jgi:SAM-dependent methyltransferase/uncharacterized protein YbaR (Trm112 family)
VRADLPSLLPLVCPACRARTERGREMHTLSLAATVRAAADGDVEEGVLACDNPACRRRYPILDGIPLIVRDLSAHLARYGAGVLEPDLHPDTAALLAAAGPDDAAYPWLVEHLSIYLDAHWGDRAQPPPDGPTPPYGFAALAARLHGTLGTAGTTPAASATASTTASARSAAERTTPDRAAPDRSAATTGSVAPRAATPTSAGPRAVPTTGTTAPAPTVARAVELGCGPGRGLYELARHADLVVGVDLQLAALRRARRLFRGQPVAYARRAAGRHYRAATLTAPPPAPASIALICSDALDPPLVPGGFDRVVALNVVDAVPNPGRLIEVVDGLCAPGGEVVLASPYAWQSGIVAEEHRLGDDDPAAAVRRRFSEGDGLESRYLVTDEADVDWGLRRDARAASVYRVHWLRVRKPG